MAGTAALDLGASLTAIGNAETAQAQVALKVKAKTKGAAQNFTGINGDGPFGGSGALGVWRSFLTDQYAKSFAKAGGIGIAGHVYDTLLKQQGASAS